MARVVVCGYMVRHPVPGNLYAFLHYVIGLRRLGHEVLYLEESGWDDSCFDPVTRSYGADPTRGLGLVHAALAHHGAGDVVVAYRDRSTNRTWGISGEDLSEALRHCDVLLNVGGVCWLPEFATVPRRVLIDMDPMFTQLGVFATEGLDAYDVLFTYGTRVGTPGCTVPTLGREWIPTVPPVVPAMWRLGPPPDTACFSTVANWSAYGSVELDGIPYRQKDVEFLALADLPERAGRRVAVAMSGCGDTDADALRSGGWDVVDAGRAVPDRRAYRTWIRHSLAEFSPAKHAYVTSRSGWLSDRSVCYLAAGRPAIVADTGFGEWFDSNEGLISFRGPEDAALVLEDVVQRYRAHSRAARRHAREIFGHDVILSRILARSGLGVTAPERC